MFVAHHFDPHSTTNHPTSPSSDPLPCSLSPTGSALDGLGFAHSQQSRQLAWPNRVHLRCGLGVSHSVAPDHASRHRPYSVLLVLSRFNNAGLSPAVISAPWRTGQRSWPLRICRCAGGAMKPVLVLPRVSKRLTMDRSAEGEMKMPQASVTLAGISAALEVNRARTARCHETL